MIASPVWASGNETTSSAQCRLWKSLAPNQIRKRFSSAGDTAETTPKIHMEAEEALGKLKRCLRWQISLHSWVRSLVSVWSPSFVGATHRRNYLHAVIHRLPNSKFPKFPRAKPLPYDFIASCHWL